MKGSPIIVVGTPRSGTTLTARLLDRHSSIRMPGETPFLRDIFSRRDQIGDPKTDREARARIVERLKTLYAQYNIGPLQAVIDRLLAESDLEERLLAAESYAEAFAIFMEAQMRDAGKRRWGNDFPGDLFDLEQIFDFYPDAKVILCSRNVLDFLVSYRDKWMRALRKSNKENSARLRRLYHPVMTSLLWKGSMKAVRAAQHKWGDRVFLNRYEDLVCSPEAQCRAICAFIEEAYETEMLNVQTDNSSYEEARSPGIFASAVGRWQQRLTHSEAYVAQMLCRREMLALGYELVSLRPNILQVAAYFVSTPYNASLGLIGNRDRRGPLLPYLAKRVAVLTRGSP